MSKKTLLSGASAAAFALAIGGTAYAAVITVPTPTATTATVSANKIINSNTGSLGTVNASTTTNTLVVTVVGTNNANTVDNNAVGAIAAGNVTAKSIDLNLYGPSSTGDAGTGIGILNFSFDTGVVTSRTDASSFTGNLTNFLSGTGDVSGNALSASTTLNTAANSVTPETVPVGITGTGGLGGIAFNSVGGGAPDVLDADGNIAVAGIQSNIGAGTLAGSTAQVGGTTANNVNLNVGNSGAGAVNVGGTLKENTNSLSATYIGNTATNSVGLLAGGTPSYTGSVVVANAQANQESGAAGTPLAANNAGSTVNATVSETAGGAAGTGTETLIGALSVDSNSISSSATNNSAVGATAGTGNTISVGNGVDFAATAGQTSENVVAIGSGGLFSGATNGALAVFNAQVSTTAANAPLNAVTTGASVNSTVQNAVGAQVATNTNSITSLTEGDAAVNSIAAGGALSASIVGSANVGSVQIDNKILQSSTTTNGLVDSSVGTGAGGTITGSQVNVDTNTVGARAYGNDVNNSLGLAADTVTSGSTSTALSAVRVAGTSSNFNANAGNATTNGSAITSVQAVYHFTGGADGEVATNTNPGVSLAAGNVNGLTGDQLSVSSNLLQAIAEANTGTSALVVSGDTFSGSLGALNGQTNETAVTATITSAQSLLVAGGGGGTVTGSQLTDSSNNARAIAYGNQELGNTVSVTGTSITVPGSGVVSTSVTVNPASGLLFDASGVAPTVTAGVAVLGVQAGSDGNADVTASNTLGGAPAVLLQVGNSTTTGDLSGGQAKADLNQVTSAAVGNLGTNGATLTGGSIVLSGAATHPSVASVGNIQELQNGVDVSTTTTTGAPATPDVRVLLSHDALGTAVEANTNTVSADVEGNTSTNSLTVTATSLVAPTSGISTGAVYTGTGNTLTNDAALTITNAQGSGTGNRTVTATDNGVHIDVNNNVTASQLTANTNHVLASASDNTTTNNLTVDPALLQAASSVQSLQISKASLTVNQGEATTPAIPGNPGTTIPAVNGTGWADTPTQGFAVTGTSAVLTGNPLFFDVTALTPSERTALLNFFNAGTPNASITGNTLTLAVGSYTLAQAGVYTSGNTYYQLATGGTIPSFTFGTTTGSPAVAGSGIVITFGGTAAARSTLTVNTNVYDASANANTATNTVSVTATSLNKATGAINPANQGALYTLVTGASSATGDVTIQNLQQASGTLSTTDNATTSIIASATPTVADLVTGSQESVHGNAATASAQGNLATNTATVTAVNSPSVGTAATAAVVSVQTSTSTSTASTSNDVAQVDGLVSTSTVDVSKNTNLALSATNTATNSLTAGGGASLNSGYGLAGFAGTGTVSGQVGASADFAVTNVQIASVAATVASTANTNVGNSDAAPTTGTLTVDHSGLTFNNNSGSAQSSVNLSTNSLTLNPGATLSASGALTNSQASISAATSTSTTSVTHQEPNATVSQISIDGNLSSAVTYGNKGTSTVTASGVTVSLANAGGTPTGAIDAGTGKAATTQGAFADYALANLQVHSNANLSATNIGTFSQSETIPVIAGAAATTGSTLSVSTNAAQAAAEANVAANSLKITATDAVNGVGTHAATGALYSQQATLLGASHVVANSTEHVSATGMVRTSTVDLNGNTNLALARGGDATNTVSASGDQFASGNTTTFAGQGATLNANNTTTGNVSADLSLQNVQLVTGSDASISATATTTILNSDALAAGAQALSASTVSIVGNKTTAEAEANLSDNSLTLNAGSTLGAVAGVLNQQSNTVSTQSAVSGTLGYSEPNASASSVSMTGNQSTSEATGNSTTNALNATASAQYSIPASLSSATTNDVTSASQVVSQFAVLNSQTNAASVSATNTTTQTVALNSTGSAAAGGTVTNSTLTNSNNAVLAQATGNASDNSIVLGITAVGTAPAAISNIQTNTGSISASTTNSIASISAGLGTGAGVSGSTISVNANSMVARATGNSSVSAITGK